MEFKEGKTYYLYDERAEHDVCKAHILHVLPHPEYPNDRLIVYRWFGKHKRWWWYGVTSVSHQDELAEHVTKMVRRFIKRQSNTNY